MRYVDDIGTVVNNTDEARELLVLLNNKHPTIQFELELPDKDDFLPILDVKLKIDERGNIKYKLYRKAANKGLTLHYSSHHPHNVKRAVAQNELRRATRCSTTDYRKEALQSTAARLLQNGYPRTLTHPQTKAEKSKPKRPAIVPLFHFNVPFVSDALNGKIRRLLQQHDIPARLVQ